MTTRSPATTESDGNQPPPGSIADLYREVFPLIEIDAVLTKGGDVALTIPSDQIHEVLERSRDDERLQMNLLRNQTAVDWEDRGLELVYHLYSIPLRQAVAIKAWAPSEGAVVESVADIYLMADWAERECREMFGIEFIGHPDPRNLLLDEDLDIHPLRKSHPLAEIEIEQGVDVEYFTKEYPPPEPEEEVEEAAPATAAPTRKRVEDMTEEEREERRAEQAERVARARELAAVRRAERLAGAPPAGGPRPEGAAPPPPPAAATAAEAPAAETAQSGPSAPARDDRPPAPPPPELPSIPDSEEDPEGRAAAQAERVRLGRELAAARRAQLRGE